MSNKDKSQNRRGGGKLNVGHEILLSPTPKEMITQISKAKAADSVISSSQGKTSSQEDGSSYQSKESPSGTSVSSNDSSKRGLEKRRRKRKEILEKEDKEEGKRAAREIATVGKEENRREKKEGRELMKGSTSREREDGGSEKDRKEKKESRELMKRSTSREREDGGSEKDRKEKKESRELMKRSTSRDREDGGKEEDRREKKGDRESMKRRREGERLSREDGKRQSRKSDEHRRSQRSQDGTESKRKAREGSKDNDGESDNGSVSWSERHMGSGSDWGTAEWSDQSGMSRVTFDDEVDESGTNIDTKHSHEQYTSHLADHDDDAASDEHKQRDRVPELRSHEEHTRGGSRSNSKTHSHSHGHSHSHRHSSHDKRGRSSTDGQDGTTRAPMHRSDEEGLPFDGDLRRPGDDDPFDGKGGPPGGAGKGSFPAVNPPKGTRDTVGQYLIEHKIGDLFDTFLVALLQAKPEKPADFLYQMARDMNHQRKIAKRAENIRDQCPCDELLPGSVHDLSRPPTQ